jgi:acetoin:2,6-dichlorophenolindophenol oxidoreductase subunit beta
MPETALSTETRSLTYVQAVNEALRWALEEFPNALFFGEDVALPGGPYGASKGLRKQFGERVFDTPISESAMLGAAVGAAMRGRRPIVEIMFGDFFLVALDQVVNQAANVRYVSQGRFSCPITVRSQQAAVPGACAQHSQSLEAFFAHVPGLRLGLPATPQDAFEMLRTAVACDDPVIIFESRALYQEKADIDLSGPLQPLGAAHRLRTGSDLTIVTWSRMVGDATRAADALAERGIAADLLDLRWLNPLDMEAVHASVKRTGRLLIAHEANLTGGFGAEIAARVATEGFWNLDAPVERVGALDVRVPASPPLNAAVIPDATTIVEAAERLLSH